MPSHLHEVLVALCREAVAELGAALVPRLGLPPGATLRPTEMAVGEPQPTELRADSVLSFHDPTDDTPLLDVIVEAQLQPDPEKRLTWPAYAMNQRYHRRVPVVVLVVTPSTAVARWAAEPIATGPGSVFVPAVLALDDLPLPRTVEEAAAHPYATVLAAIVHAEAPDAVAVSNLAMAAIAKSLSPERQRMCIMALWKALDRAVHAEMEAQMDFESLPQPQVEIEDDPELPMFFKRGVALGRQRGREEGRQEGLIEDLLDVLDVRGLVPTEAQRATIRSCRDIALLKAWHRRALTAVSADAVFEG